MIVSLNLVQTKNFVQRAIRKAKSLEQNTANTINTPQKLQYVQKNVVFLGKRPNRAQYDPFSFEEFNKRRIEAKIFDEDDLKDEICPENLIGTGANSNVYQFSDPKLKNWVLKEDKKPIAPAKKGFQRTDNIFGRENMGQEIASIGSKYHILKRIEGEPHSLKDWSYHINNDSKISKDEAKEFLSHLESIADFPAKSFDDYANTLKILSDKGFKMDSINPNNLLIDYKNKTIHIIDFFKAADPSHIDSSFDLTNCLIDFSMFSFMHDKLDSEDREKLIKTAKTIATKCNNAAKKAGLPDNEKIYTDYIANVDKWFGFALKDKGGTYKERYDATKALLQ